LPGTVQNGHEVCPKLPAIAENALILHELWGNVLKNKELFRFYFLCNHALKCMLSTLRAIRFAVKVKSSKAPLR